MSRENVVILLLGEVGVGDLLHQPVLADVVVVAVISAVGHAWQLIRQGLGCGRLQTRTGMGIVVKSRATGAAGARSQLGRFNVLLWLLLWLLLGVCWRTT